MKTILFLADGMADEPLPELGGKTPVEYAHTPHMDKIAQEGACGTFLTLPEGYPTSSDVANMSVLGYDPSVHYTGRGPLEALSQGIKMAQDDIAWRCNLIYAEGDTLVDYSGGHINNDDARQLMHDLGKTFNTTERTFYPGVSYRNLLLLHGSQFTDKVHYEKPDASQGMLISDLLLQPGDESPAARYTATYLNNLMLETRSFLAAHPINQGRKCPANMIWLWSPGPQPRLPSFSEKYGGIRAAIISAVDVIFGLGACVGMDIIRVPGATGFIDTNYEGKADAAVAALDTHDFVYVHVEAPDECSHLGDLKLKLQAIEDLDRRLMGRVMEQLQGEAVTFALLPDHPVPVRLRIHTRDPVPFAIWGRHILRDDCTHYSEREALRGALGFQRGEGLMRLVLNLPLSAYQTGRVKG